MEKCIDPIVYLRNLVIDSLENQEQLVDFAKANLAHMREGYRKGARKLDHVLMTWASFYVEYLAYQNLLLLKALLTCDSSVIEGDAQCALLALDATLQEIGPESDYEYFTFGESAEEVTQAILNWARGFDSDPAQFQAVIRHACARLYRPDEGWVWRKLAENLQRTCEIFNSHSSSFQNTTKVLNNVDPIITWMNQLGRTNTIMDPWEIYKEYGFVVTGRSVLFRANNEDLQTEIDLMAEELNPTLEECLLAGIKEAQDLLDNENVWKREYPHMFGDYEEEGRWGDETEELFVDDEAEPVWKYSWRETTDRLSW